MLKKYYSLSVWICALLFIGSIIGRMTAPQIPNWYNHLVRSSLTPPDYVFSIAWTILYAMIGYCGWLIWQAPYFSRLKQIKVLFILQILLNWAWTPLFFKMHLIMPALICLILITILVTTIIYKCYPSLLKVCLLLSPYLGWLCFAGYLNYFIWQNN